MGTGCPQPDTDLESMGKLKPSLHAVFDRVETLTGRVLVGLVGSLVVFFLAMSCQAAQIENEFLEVEKTARDSQSLPRKVLKNESRLLPVPIPISNPTVGAGLAVAGIYLHPQEQEDTTGSTTTSGVLGMYTNTESWAVGGFHDGYYRDDRIRFRAAGGVR